jgi:hypothetical protein
LPLFFPFRIGPADAGPAVGDAISTSCGDGRDAPPFLDHAAAFGEGSDSAAVGWNGPGCLGGGVGKSITLGNLEREGRAEIGGEGSEANEPFADITSGLRMSGSVRDCTEGQPNRLFEDFCFAGRLKDVPVGVPGRDIGCILGGGGCWGVLLDSEEPSPGCTPCDDLDPSTMVGWRSIGGCLVDPFKDGADWLVVKLDCCLLEFDTEVCGEVLIGVRIGRVGVVDVAPRGLDGDEPKIPAAGFVSGVVDDNDAPNACPGEKACALGLSAAAEAAVDMGGVELGLKLIFDPLLANPNGALCEAAKKEDGGASTAAAGVGVPDGVVLGLAKGDPKRDVAFPCSPRFDTTGADVDGPKGENDEFAFAVSRRLDTTSAVEPEALGTEEVVDPKADAEEACPPNAEDDDDELPPNAELAPKRRLPTNTFGVVLRFANAEAAGTTEVGGAVSGVEDPKTETGAGAGDAPKAEVDDELAPNMAEGEGLAPKVSHSVALGFNGLGWWCDSAGSPGSSMIGWSSRKKASSSS